MKASLGVGHLSSCLNTDYNNKVGTRVLDDTTLGAGAGMKARMWVERTVIDNERGTNKW